MNTQELKVSYKKLLNKAAQANGRKETVSYLNRAAKIKSKLYSTSKVNCFRCNGAGFLRISLDETKTCLSCYGKGLFMKDLIQAHKKLIKTVKEQMGFSDYGMYWLAFLEGGLTIWLLDRIFFHWLKF